MPAPKDDAALNCQEWVEEHVHRLVDMAAAAGWSEMQAAEAIIAIAEHRVLAGIENELVRAKLAQIQASMGGRPRHN
ncbi:hypothetical protein [Metarhizobium album]|uniref:hypothetical protein n=1 Tax=Metarhizobium album TaxID=2182425 RepID=UPI000FFE93FF|nr:hypothetical protein [Rhizobium album]